MNRLFAYFLIVCMFAISVFTANAGTDDVFADGVVCSQEEQQELLKNYRLRPLVAEPQKNVFRYFDVNSEGMVALVYDALRREGEDIIVVYSSEGVFQYGYQLANTGYIGVVWKGEQLYISNSRYSLLVDDQKRCVEIKKIPQSNEWSPYSSTKKSKTVNGSIYQASEKVNFDNYSVLTKTDSVGETVIFKSSNKVIRQKNEKKVYEILTFLALAVGLFIYVFVNIKKNIAKRQSGKTV